MEHNYDTVEWDTALPCGHTPRDHKKTADEFIKEVVGTEFQTRPVSVQDQKMVIINNFLMNLPLSIQDAFVEHLVEEVEKEITMFFNHPLLILAQGIIDKTDKIENVFKWKIIEFRPDLDAAINHIVGMYWRNLF